MTSPHSDGQTPGTPPLRYPLRSHRREKAWAKLMKFTPAPDADLTNQIPYLATLLVEWQKKEWARQRDLT